MSSERGDVFLPTLHERNDPVLQSACKSFSKALSWPANMLQKLQIFLIAYQTFLYCIRYLMSSERGDVFLPTLHERNDSVLQSACKSFSQALSWPANMLQKLQIFLIAYQTFYIVYDI